MLFRSIVRFLGRAEVRERLAAQGAVAATGTPEQLGAHLRSELAKWSRVIKSSGAKVD